MFNLWNSGFLYRHCIYIYLLTIIINNLYNIYLGSPLLCDSLPETDKLIDDYTVNQVDNTNTTVAVPPLNRSSKIKSWLYWRMFIKNSRNYKPYQEFKSSWNENYNFKSAFKSEFQDFNSHPFTYIKNNYQYKMDRVHCENLNKGTNFTRAEIRSLEKNGYKVVDGIIQKI